MQDFAFRKANTLEHLGDIDGAIACYELILANVEDARAAVNLGTICYNRNNILRAIELYRRATEIAPHYPLAWYNLGNALDELLMITAAIEAYRTALRLAPDYGDAHYNLALALHMAGKPRQALKHWRAYVRLDPAGPWADHARRQIRKAVTVERLQIVHTGTRQFHGRSTK